MDSSFEDALPRQSLMSTARLVPLGYVGEREKNVNNSEDLMVRLGTEPEPAE
jgi:hypothetical protein